MQRVICSPPLAKLEDIGRWMTNIIGLHGALGGYTARSIQSFQILAEEGILRAVVVFYVTD